VIDDLLAFVHDAKPRGLVARLIECVLVFPIDSDVAHRYAGDLLQLPAHSAPIDAADGDRKTFVVRLLVEKLGKDFLRALQAIRFATLLMQGCVGVEESLDAAPRKGSDFYSFAGHCASSSLFQSIFPFLSPVSTSSTASMTAWGLSN
jgi:hypothetical protein